jgi:hypothetical protein
LGQDRTHTLQHVEEIQLGQICQGRSSATLRLIISATNQFRAAVDPQAEIHSERLRR